MKTKGKKKYQGVPFYKLILRYIALKERKVTIEEIRDVYDKDYNELGRSRNHINKVLREQERRGYIKSERYDNGKRGPNPKRYWITESGMKGIAHRWPDLEYDEDRRELKKKDI